jgi:hypothetical protein
MSDALLALSKVQAAHAPVLSLCSSVTGWRDAAFCSIPTVQPQSRSRLPSALARRRRLRVGLAARGGRGGIGIRRTVPLSRVWMVRSLPPGPPSAWSAELMRVGWGSTISDRACSSQLTYRCPLGTHRSECLGLGAEAPLSLAVRRARAAASCRLSAACLEAAPTLRG